MPGAAHNRTPLYVRWADRYQIVRRIGAGGFAEVFEAYDRRLERPVALKVVPEERGMSGRVVREVEAALSLSHPGIVALYDFFSDGERSYLVWELIEGESLAVAGPRLHDAEAAEVMAEVLEALAYAHSQGVVHRDIKPQNIMIDRAGRAKIMDFGIARLIDAETLTSEGDVLGTVAYMSPEQADGRRAGPASDVYSSAIVLYELLAGHNPVRGATAAETLSNVIAGRMTPLEEVRPHVPMDVADAVYAASAPREIGRAHV
jgi:serine/threonine protein kinase